MIQKKTAGNSSTSPETIAVVGASNNPEKYGYKVFANLKSRGMKAIPINLKDKEVQGVKAFPSIKDVKEKIGRVVFVVPPESTEAVLRDVKEKGIKKVWMQPGSESEKAIKFCEDNGIDCIYNACIMAQVQK